METMGTAAAPPLRLGVSTSPSSANLCNSHMIILDISTICTLDGYLIVGTSRYHLKGRGMPIIWILFSSSYLLYLHGACVVFVLSIASMNYFLVKMFAQSRYYSYVLWLFNLAVLLLNRIYEGYSFSMLGQQWGFLDNHHGTFRWHIFFNLVVLRMISFGCDYYWSKKDSLFNLKNHMQRCHICYPGKACYLVLQVANLVGYVIGPTGANWLASRLLQREGLPILGGIFLTFYVGTKLVTHS